MTRIPLRYAGHNSREAVNGMAHCRPLSKLSAKIEIPERQLLLVEPYAVILMEI